MSFDINSMRTDEDLENAGVWRDLGNGAKLLLARLGNAEFKKMFNELTRPYAESGADIPPEVQLEVTVKCLARTVLLGWEGIVDTAKGDKPLPYSYENAIRVLEEVKDFRELVIKLASGLDAYKKNNDKAIEGNSKSASAGSSNTETK